MASSDHGSWPMVSSAGPAAVSSTATTPGSVDEVSHNSSRSVSSSNVVSSTGNKLVHQVSRKLFVFVSNYYIFIDK